MLLSVLQCPSRTSHLVDMPMDAVTTLDLDMLRSWLEPGQEQRRSRGRGRSEPPRSTGDCRSPETCCLPCTTRFKALERALSQQRRHATALSRLLEEHSAALEALWEVVAALQERSSRPIPNAGEDPLRQDLYDRDLQRDRRGRSMSRRSRTPARSDALLSTHGSMPSAETCSSSEGSYRPAANLALESRGPSGKHPHR